MLEAVEGVTMTEAEWLNAADATKLWAVARDLMEFNRRVIAPREPEYNQRLLYLAGVAVCRRLEHLFPYAICHRVLHVAESFAEGKASLDELCDAHDDVEGERRSRPSNLLPAASWAAVNAVYWLNTDDYKVIRAVDHVSDAAGYLRAVAAGVLPAEATGDAGRAVWKHPAFLAGKAEEEQALCDIIREIIGNPSRPVAVEPSWLAWRDRAVVKMAQAAYEDRLLPSGQLDAARLSILADALEDAGCSDTDLLGHLRGPGPHVRGCWVVDLLLGKR
jgi:hypothetical protein